MDVGERFAVVDNSWERGLDSTEVVLVELRILALEHKSLEFVVVEQLEVLIEGDRRHDRLDERRSGVRHVDLLERSDLISSRQQEPVVHLTSELSA